MLSCKFNNIQFNVDQKTEGSRYLNLYDGDNNHPELHINNMKIVNIISSSGTSGSQEYILMTGHDVLVIKSFEQMLTKELYNQRSKLFKNPGEVPYEIFSQTFRGCTRNDNTVLIKNNITVEQNNDAYECVIILKGIKVFKKLLECDFELSSIVKEETIDDDRLSLMSDEDEYSHDVSKSNNIIYMNNKQSVDYIQNDNIDLDNIERVNIQFVDDSDYESDTNDQINAKTNELNHLQNELDNYISKINKLKSIVKESEEVIDESI